MRRKTPQINITIIKNQFSNVGSRHNYENTEMHYSSGHMTTQELSCENRNAENMYLIKKTNNIQVTVLCCQVQRPVTNTTLQQVTAYTHYEFNYVHLLAKTLFIMYS